MNKTTFNSSKSMEKFFLLAIAAFLSLVFLLSGCNTVEGIGEDVEAAGGRIEDAAD